MLNPCKLQHLVVGEAMAALEAVEFSREVGLQEVIVEGDSLQVVQALRETKQNWSIYGHIVEDARMTLNTRKSWMVFHVKREANATTHVLAKNALSEDSHCPNVLNVVVLIMAHALLCHVVERDSMCNAPILFYL